jgi:hypothetical protein
MPDLTVLNMEQAGLTDRRAPRFAIPIAMLYRSAGDPTWREGRAENISRSGVLFRAEQLIEPDTSIEMLMVLPSEVTGEAAGTSMCYGRIVRTISPGSDARPILAAAILQWERLPQDPRRI